MDSDCAILGFNVVDPSVKDVALTKLGLDRHPPTSMIVSLLEKGAPRTHDLARQWFEVLAGRIGGKRGSADD